MAYNRWVPARFQTLHSNADNDSGAYFGYLVYRLMELLAYRKMLLPPSAIYKQFKNCLDIEGGDRNILRNVCINKLTRRHIPGDLNINLLFAYRIVKVTL
jgi:hypothetical protein